MINGPSKPSTAVSGQAAKLISRTCLLQQHCTVPNHTMRESSLDLNDVISVLNIRCLIDALSSYEYVVRRAQVQGPDRQAATKRAASLTPLQAASDKRMRLAQVRY